MKQKITTPHQKYLDGIRHKKRIILAWQIGLLFGIIVAWELLTDVGIMDAFFMSSPSRIFTTICDLIASGDFFYHIGVTLGECLAGFAISMLIGSFIAVLLWLFENAQRIAEPYLVVLNALPKIALGPLIIIWVGSGVKAIVLMAIMICIIVTVISVLDGLNQTSPEKILLLRSMGANRLQILLHAVLPSALPTIISVIKINVGLSWVGTIMGEYLVSSAGLGYLIVYGGQVFKTDLVMASTVTLCLLAGGMYGLFSLIEKAFLRKKRKTSESV